MVFLTQRYKFGMQNVGICVLWPFGIFYGHLVYFAPLVHFVWFGIFFIASVWCTKKNPATLVPTAVLGDSRVILNTGIDVGM
jgi:hypothetical protein